MFCSKCGNKIIEGTHFCDKCGNPVGENPLPKHSYEPKGSTSVQIDSTACVQTKSNGGFAQKWLIPIITAGFFVIFFLIGAIGNRNYLSGNNLENIFKLFFSYCIPAMIIVLSIRAKGIDLSFFGMASLAGIFITLLEGSFVGLIVTILLMAIFGLINGVLINYLRLPAFIVTFITGAFTYNLSRLFWETENSGYPIQINTHFNLFLVAVIFAVIAIGITVLLMLVGKLKKSREERGFKDKSFFNVLIYMITGAFSCLYSFYSSSRIFSNCTINFLDFIPLTVFVVLIIYGVIHTKHRILAVPFAAFAALLYAVLYNTLIMLNLYDYLCSVIYLLLAFALIVVFAIVNRKKLSDFILLRSKQ